MRSHTHIMWLMVAMMVVALASCDKSDEENYVDGYYMTIQSQVSLNLDDDDESQGTMSDNQYDIMSKTIVNMRKALAGATSLQNSRQANDAAAIRACDSIYNDYVKSYVKDKGKIVCFVKIIRSKLVDGVAIDSYSLKTYHFWIIEAEPPETTSSIKKPADLAMVDLGLSVLWANCNLGATGVEDFGGHYAWGDPTGKLWSGAGISWNLETNIYKWNTDNYGGNNPPEDISGTDLDIVHVNWGDGWRMPTYDEAKELFEKCQWKLRNRGDIKWYEVIGPNGNSVIFKLTGYYADDMINRFHAGPYFMNEIGYYWTSTICPTPFPAENRGYGIEDSVKTAWMFYCNSNQGDLTGTPKLIDQLRAYHFSIRPVHDRTYHY